MSDSTVLLAALETMGIACSLHEHAAVFTVEESADLHAAIPGAHTKNLFLKDAGDRFWLVTVPHDLAVDLKALPGVIGSKKLSFGKADAMERLIGVTPGSVTPLGAFNDTGQMVTIVIDKRLADNDLVNVHPLRNTATIGLSGADLVRALTHWQHPPVIAVIPARS